MGFLSNLVSLLLGTKISTTNPQLSQNSTNGNSALGTFNAPHLQSFLTNNPLPDGYPWGPDTVNNTNPYSSSPTTGVVRTYNFTISRGTLTPDGYQRSMILINGGYPGPLIECNWGDTIQVTVNNNISNPAEGTGIHWHGFLQHRSQWADGVPGISQCPIPPGKSFTYSFKAELYGTSWYHAHYSASYIDGVVGPIVVHGPNNMNYDIDLGPVTLSDYYHKTYYQMLEYVLAPSEAPPSPTSDNNLINGKGEFNCNSSDPTPCVSNAGMAKFSFTAGKRHLLRLVNTGADGTQQFSIDGHVMTVIANDFVPVKVWGSRLWNVLSLTFSSHTTPLSSHLALVNALTSSSSLISP